MAADFADVHFLGVGTPQKKGQYGADLRYLHAVIDELVPLLTRPSVIVGKSTVPVGTAADLGRRARALLRPDVEFEIAWNPEFLREGFAVHDSLHPDRIVIGTEQSSTLAEGALRRRVGFSLEGKAPAREGAPVTDRDGKPLGVVTSGGFGPSVGAPIAMGYVSIAAAQPGTPVNLVVRDQPRAASVIAMPFSPHRYHRS
jgi:hypothetical protein